MDAHERIESVLVHAGMDARQAATASRRLLSVQRGSRALEAAYQLAAALQDPVRKKRTMRDILVLGKDWWSTARTRDAARDVERHLARRAPPSDEVEEGVNECYRCGSKKTISQTVQTRSGDEGATTFVACINCKHRWKMG